MIEPGDKVLVRDPGGYRSTRVGTVHKVYPTTGVVLVSITNDKGWAYLENVEIEDLTAINIGETT